MKIWIKKIINWYYTYIHICKAYWTKILKFIRQCKLFNIYFSKSNYLQQLNYKLMLNMLNTEKEYMRKKFNGFSL